MVGGISNDVGIVVAAGTGSIVFGRNHRGETKRVGGWGYILGDEGGAYQIAVAGMRTELPSCMTSIGAFRRLSVLSLMQILERFQREPH